MAHFTILAALALQLCEALRVPLSGNSIPNIIWVTGPWSVHDKEFTEVEENMNGPFLKDREGSRFTSAREMSDQKRAKVEFSKWVPIGSRIRYFNNEDMKASARNISDMLAEKGIISNAYEAFSNLRPAAFRADLWRYMILWAYGGVYLDSDLRLHARLEKWINFKNDKLVLVNDTAAPECAYWNAMMAAAPRSAVLERVIPAMVDNIMDHYYGENCLAITGPVALCRAIQKNTKGRYDEFQRQTRIELRKVNGIEKREFFVVGNDGTAMASKDEGLHYFEDPRRHYGPLWRNKQVYCDQPGPEEDLGLCEERTQPAGQNETSAALEPSAEANLTAA